MQRHCPRDRTPLAPRKMDGVAVDVCPKCQGAFFDERELGKVTGDKDLARYLSQVHGAASSPMVCPACGNLMDLDKVGEVELDHCTSCLGVWLDAGEMDRLLAREETALDAGADAKARAAEERRYREMPRGGGGGRFAALGQAFRLVAWKLKRRK
ncbi:MAG TPA: zf-TFIIB domain-containing protein [Candidatus Thermoplasmatota archaeon]|nr:zf-TFIIB domain-containing protein [Candidatus Thermoplasmatota archaeon]